MKVYNRNILINDMSTIIVCPFQAFYIEAILRQISIDLLSFYGCYHTCFFITPQGKGKFLVRGEIWVSISVLDQYKDT